MASGWKLLAVGTAGLAIGVGAFWWMSGPSLPHDGDTAVVTPPRSAPPHGDRSTAPDSTPDPMPDATSPPPAAGSRPPQPERASDEVTPVPQDDCADCYHGVSLSWDRDPDQIDAIRHWSKEEHNAASEEIWRRHEAGELDYAEARRDDQSLQVDRVLGGELDPEIRTQILDIHEEMQAALTQAREAGLGPEGQVDAMAAYEDALEDLLRPDQVDRLLGRAPSPAE